MGRKGKTQTHTAKELASKHAAAKAAAGGVGGGAALAAKRKAAGEKVAVLCEICKAVQPNIQSMERHYDSKHAKENWRDVWCAKYTVRCPSGPEWQTLATRSRTARCSRQEMFGANKQNLKESDATFQQKMDPKEKAKAKAAREEKKRLAEEKKLGLLKGGGAAGGGAAETEDQKIARLQKQFMPLVKKGEGLEESGDLAGALALYQEAMTGFRSEGVKRPKLKEKMDSVKAKMGEA